MSSYDKNGTLLTSLFDLSGSLLASAYDIGGELVYPDIDPEDYNFVLMSFNVQSWSGINSWANVGGIISEYDADIIGTQESHTSNYMTGLGYTYTAIGADQRENIVFSKSVLSDITSVSYETNMYEGKRGYQKMYFPFGDKRIAFFNTHLETSKNSRYQYAQAAELLEAVSQEEYFILTGDFNSHCRSTDDPGYINIIKPFVDAGYNVANCSRFGFIDTVTSGTDESGTWWPVDNIITSANIQMSNVVVDRTKVELETGLTIDHLPIIAYLKIPA